MRSGPVILDSSDISLFFRDIYNKTNMRIITPYDSWLKESVVYNLDDDKYTSNEQQKSIVDYYISDIERATGTKVVTVEGSVSETDCDLYFELEDGISVDIEVIYAPYGGLTKVFINDGNNRYERSFGSIERYGSNEYGKNKEYEDMDNPIYHMVNDMYREYGLIEISYTHKIRLPRELFGNSPYFHYDSDEEKDQHVVYFENEEAAQAWINSLKISTNNEL